jgi:hypothetical protein
MFSLLPRTSSATRRVPRKLKTSSIFLKLLRAPQSFAVAFGTLAEPSSRPLWAASLLGVAIIS